MMDPDAALAEIRSLVKHIQDGHAAGEDCAEQDAERLAELVNGLDEWRCKGGFLPEAWQKRDA